MKNQNAVNAIGWFGVVMACIMFGTFIDQLMLNWIGKTGSVWLPAATIVNCAAWTFYGLYKMERDWKIVLPNALGILLSIPTLWTAVYCTSGCSFY